VQNPANVGGLCRTAEVFRLESLVIANGAIAQDAAFKRVAVSSQQWQPFEICPVVSLPEWIARQQSHHYTVIALHPDAQAVSLTHFTFPPQSVLVLGVELTGIPSHILQCCDRIITIPQFGRVESLNVHTAGAIAIYEYVRQHGLEPAQMDRDR
jgi:tRNA G18 (ribose-2'-O)-methylase SpoU